MTARGGLPSVRLAKGRHTPTGGFVWDAPPPLMPVPLGPGLLHLTLRGRPVPFPARDEQGGVWLENKAGGGREESRLAMLLAVPR